MAERSATRVREDRSVRVARRRFARRQWARRWLAWRGMLLTVLVGGAVAALVWLVFFSSVFAVSGVTVEGADVLSPERVREAADVPRGEPLATVDLDAVTARVESLAPVQAVDVSRSWPDKVRILVQERTAVAVVVRDGVVRGLSADGVLFRRFPEPPGRLPEVRTSAGVGSEALTEAARVVGALPEDLAGRVAYVDVESVDAVSLRMRDGRVVVWGSAEDSDLKARVLEVLLGAAPHATTYDVSVPGQPTTRQ